MKVSQIIRSDSQKTQEQLNKKINKEITAVVTPTRLTCLSMSDQLAKAESDKRLKMKIHKSSRRLDLRKSKVRREPLSTLTKFKHRSPDKTQAAKDTKIQWRKKKKICRLE
jgi:hypothetical protein